MNTTLQYQKRMLDGYAPSTAFATKAALCSSSSIEPSHAETSATLHCRTSVVFVTIFFAPALLAFSTHGIAADNRDQLFQKRALNVEMFKTLLTLWSSEFSRTVAESEALNLNAERRSRTVRYARLRASAYAVQRMRSRTTPFPHLVYF